MDLVPVRMLNEIAYCPRLFAIEHLFGDFADNAHTVEGRNVHTRVDRPTRVALPAAEELPEVDTPPKVVRRVHLSDPNLALTGILDLVACDGEQLVPIDHKKGRTAPVPERAWLPERVQVCAQALLLRAHGYTVPHGELYFHGSRTRVRVDLTEALIAETLRCRDAALQLIVTPTLPPPLLDSPKCRGCSLVAHCLPDEEATLRGEHGPPDRQLVPARDDTLPLHVRLKGGRAGLSAGEIVVKDREGSVAAKVRLHDTSTVVLHGNITVTTPLIAALAKRDIPLAWHSHSGWYQGTMQSASGRNVLIRHAQHLWAADTPRALELAKSFVQAKVKNQRVLLRRNGTDVPKAVLARMKDCAHQVVHAPDADTLRGLEGLAARDYFAHFPSMLRSDLRETFDMDGRNRRPPRDPVNALLSFAYAMLVREFTHIAHRVGFDPHVGFLHTMRPGRPALALDLMEEFRPIVADSAVLSALNNGVVQAADFERSGVGVHLLPAAKKRFIATVERRLDELVTHPTLQTRWSYRRTLEVQARLVSRVLMGRLPAYPGFTVR